MSAGHTPGPWAVNADDMSDNDALTIGINDPNGEFLASANGFVAEEYEPGVWGAGLRGDIEVVRSNARLIAAAPELLEALQFIREHGEEFSELAAKKAIAAINKATGGAT